MASFFKKNKLALVITSVYAICLVLAFCFPLVLAEHYNEAYGNTFFMENAVADFSGSNLNKSIDPKLDGEWEFYFNKWLVTDGIEDRIPDTLLKPSQQWSSATVDGKKLPREGYASYRVILKNLPQTESFRVNTQNAAVAWRAYLDGELVSYCGTLSKDSSENCPMDNQLHTLAVPIEEGRTYELIVEVSANKLGGIGMPTTISVRPVTSARRFIRNTSVAAGLVIGMLSIAIIFLIIITVSTKKWKQNLLFATLLTMVALFLLTSVDFTLLRWDSLGAISNVYVPIVNYGASLCMLLFFFLYSRSVGAIKMTTKQAIIFLCAAVLPVLPTVFTLGYRACFVLYSVNIVTFGVLTWFLCKNAKGQLFENLMRIIMLLALQVNCILSAMDYLDIIIWGISQICSYTSLFVMATSIGLFASQIVRDYKKIIFLTERARETDRVRSQVLKAQIKPHFIFNTLACVKGNYHVSLENGDFALDALARHLRNNVDADISDTIPFSRELDNIINYFDLENLRNDNKLTLLIDAEYTDFELPLLSLQPLVENAIKYSQTQYVTDGYIQIRSYLDGDYTCVEVTDNGVGFDVSAIPLTSVGLRNIRARLQYLLNAETVIESSPGNGTRVIIKIPPKEKK